MRMRQFGYVWAACVTAMLAAPAQGQDTTFGDQGFAFAGFGDLLHDFSNIEAVAVQGDGRIVVAGHARTSGLNFTDASFAVARFTAAGALDTTFGNSGGRTLIGFEGFEFAVGVAVLSDGRVVVAGQTSASTSSGPRSIALVRLTSAGQIDTTFGASGRVTVPIGNNGAVTAMRLQPDGKILVVGSVTRTGTGADFLLVRFHGSGALDTSFGQSGSFPNLSASVALDFGGQERANAIALQSDGRIVAAGVTQVTTDSRFALARFSANGLLDTSFGASGRVTTNFASSDHGGSTGDSAFGVVLQPDGRIVVAGRAETNTSLAKTDVALARYMPDGALDTSFSGDGKRTLAFTTDADVADAAFDVAIQPDGRIVTVGFTEVPFGSRFALARFNDTGSIDTGFGDNGKIVTDARGHQAFALAPQATLFNSSFVVGGQGAPTGQTTRFAITRVFAFVRTILPNGAFDLGPTDATIREGERLTYDFAWTVPEPSNWHDLRSMELRILDGDDPVFWVRFDEATSTFTVLRLEDVSFDAASARVIGSGATGPHVTLRLPLVFGRGHFGRSLSVEVRSTSDAGEVDPFTDAGTLRIMPAKSHPK